MLHFLLQSGSRPTELSRAGGIQQSLPESLTALFLASDIKRLQAITKIGPVDMGLK